MNVKTEPGKIIVTVDEGFHEIYIDEKFTTPWLKNGQTGEYAAEPGPHRLGVRKDGAWAYNEDMIVPGETATVPGETVPEPEPEQPEKPEQPEEPEPVPVVLMSASIIRDLIAEMRDIADMMEALLNPREGE